MTPTDPPMPAPALDYALVRQQYPAAFAAFLSHWFDSPTMGEHILSLGEWRRDKYIEQATLHPRDMYDFFDSQGVYVEIVPCEYTKDVAWYMSGIWVIGEGNRFLSQSYPTRPAAESAAFMAAFGKLEEMLN